MITIRTTGKLKTTRGFMTMTPTLEKPTLSKSSPTFMKREEITTMPMKKRRNDNSRKTMKETCELSNERRSSRKKEKKLPSASSLSELKEARESSKERRRSSRKKTKSSEPLAECHAQEQQQTKMKETEFRQEQEFLVRQTSDPSLALQFLSSTSSLQSNASSFSRLSAKSALNRVEIQSIVECIRKDKMNIEKRLSCGSCGGGGVLTVRAETDFEYERTILLQKWSSMNMERRAKFSSRAA
jgi:hypothetical protein